MQPLYIYWLKETNYCFFKNWKQSTRQDSTKFMHSIWMDMTKQPTKFNFLLTSINEYFTTENQLVCSREMTVSTRCMCITKL